MIFRPCGRLLPGGERNSARRPPLVRRYQVRRWLACVLEFRGRRRPIMRPRRYTELFFLDEAVALAAGHRPCAECRHAAYQSFRTAWTTARALPAKPAADGIDQVLHWQRRLVDGARVTYPALLSELPDGVFIVHDEEFWLVNDGGLNRWTPAAAGINPGEAKIRVGLEEP